MSVEMIKWIMIGAMALVTIIFGLLPIKLMNYLSNEQSRMHKRAPLILSLLSCFAGGVFLAVCFLDMLPDSLEAWSNVSQCDYPVVQLIALSGFFFVYFIEEISTSLCGIGHGHSHSEIAEIENNLTFPRARLATVGSIFNSTGNIVQPCKKSLQDFDQSGEASLRASLIFTSAFILHLFFECFAFGAQKDTLSVISLFIGIVLHKSVVMFSLGMKLARNHPRRWYIVAIFIVTIAIFNVIGGSIGIIIESSSMNEIPKDICTSVLMSFSLGTFIYITFFEMLVPERANSHSNILQWICSFLGFILISIIMIWSD